MKPKKWCQENRGRWSDESRLCDFDNGVIEFGKHSIVVKKGEEKFTGIQKFGPEYIQPNPGEDLSDELVVETDDGEFLVEPNRKKIELDGPY